MRVYHPDSNTWMTAAAMPTARAGLGLARGGDGLIYAIGGYDGDGVMRTVEAYDPATDRWSASTPLPDPRRNLAAATGADGKIYVFGWHSDSYGPVSTEIFNPATKTWTSAAGNQCAIDASGAARGPDGRIYVTGFGCTAAFDPATKSWTKLPTCSRSTTGWRPDSPSRTAAGCSRWAASAGTRRATPMRTPRASTAGSSSPRCSVSAPNRRSSAARMG